MAWILVLWAGAACGDDARDRLAAAIRDARPAEARAALAELSAGDGARAAKAILVSLPRARDRMAALCADTVRARQEYDRVDSEIAFNTFDERLKRAKERLKLEITRILFGEEEEALSAGGLG